MNNKKISRALRVTALLLAIVLLLPVGAMAAEARSSLYLDSYSAYVYRAGWGKIQVWFEVNGTDYLDEIGALEIQLYESKDNANWTWVKTYDYTDHSGMLGYNDYFHGGHIEYKGTLGRYYKAYVCIWGGKDGAGDTRYFWTNSEKATLFAE